MNQQHLEWLLDGVESWNERRRNDDFAPDLQSVNIYQHFDEEGKLNDSGRIPLDRIDLRKANLSNSTLGFANLVEANLVEANLSGAALMGADLSDANLARATVDGANFIAADYIGARLAGTDFWKATLSPKEKYAKQHSIHLENITSIESLLSNIRKLEAHHPDELLFYRGHSKRFGKLSSSLMRSSLVAHESQMLTDLIATRPEEFSATTTALSRWALAQHHGLKTRFLDITKNPLVALFFACEENKETDGLLHAFAVPRDSIKPFNSDSISIVANFARLTQDEQDLVLTKRVMPNITNYDVALRHLYHYIKQEKPYFEERIDVADLFRVFVVQPQHSSERVRAQSGAFLASALRQSFEQVNTLENAGQWPVYAHYTARVAIETEDNNRKVEILRQLRSLNITRETLYPGLEESAKAVVNAYRQRMDQG